jgi:hypothetical protein
VRKHHIFPAFLLLACSLFSFFFVACAVI